MMVRMSSRCLGLLGLLALTVSCSLPPPLPRVGTPSPPPGGEVAPDSPRASLTEFALLCRKGRYEEAVRYLDLSPEEAAEGPVLARRLNAVLEDALGIDEDDLSPLPGGDPSHGLPPGMETLGAIPLDGHREAVRLVKKGEGDSARWVFSRSTVGRIDRWYAGLADHWIREKLPPALLAPGPFDLLYWQWIAVPLLFLGALLAGRLLGLLTSLVLGPLLRRAGARWGLELLSRLSSTLTLVYALGVASLFLPKVALHPAAEAVVLRVLRVGEIVALFGGILRSVDVLGEGLEVHLGDPAARSLLAVMGRAGKVLIVVLFAVTLLATFDVPVASVLAGIGIGGLGIALAAQKTVENLFGSFSLAADHAIRVGDVVQIDQVLGTVEAIGLRSTRIRTPDRTLVAIPNGRLAEMRIESLTARDRFRLACTLSLAYGTSADQIRRILKGIEEVLRGQDALFKGDLVVCLRDLGPSSLNVEVVAWFSVSLEGFRRIRQDVLLEFLEVVNREGTSLALPTQTFYVASESLKPKDASG
jgi:MscS family membrane protein